MNAAALIVPLLLVSVDPLPEKKMPTFADARNAAVTQFLVLVDAGDRSEVQRGLLLLPRFDAVAAVVPELLTRLAKGSPVQRRRAAAYALGRLGPIAAAARPALENALSVSDPDVRGLAASALGRLGQPGQGVSEALVRVAASDPEIQTRSQALIAVGKIGNVNAEPVAAALRKGLTDPEGRVRHAAVLAVMNLGPFSAVFRDRLLDMARADVSTGVRVAAIHASGVAAPDMASSLLAPASDPNVDTRQAVWQALNHVKATVTDAAARAGAQDRSPAVRAEVAAALLASGEETHVPLVARMLGDPDEEVRQAAVTALVARKAKSASVFAGMLRDPNRSVGLAAAQGLRRLERNARAALPEVLAVLRDVDSDEKSSLPEPRRWRKWPLPEKALPGDLAEGAEDILIGLGPEAILPLLELLGQPIHPSVKRKTIILLGESGRNALAAAPTLAIMYDSDHWIEAFEAIEEIARDAGPRCAWLTRLACQCVAGTSETRTSHVDRDSLPDPRAVPRGHSVPRR